MTERTFTAAENLEEATLMENAIPLCVRGSQRETLARRAAMLRQAADDATRWAALKAWHQARTVIPNDERAVEWACRVAEREAHEAALAEMARIEGARA